MADGKHPSFRAIEGTHDVEHARVVPQVLRRAAAEHEHRLALVDAHFVEREVRLAPYPGRST